ncbi:MAG TPA: hypothetical protein DCE42_08605 [Myxococcales bacterium]|mgnify:CR=1 FL=1|nr:hypothetical protein [Deltaproteobacteria bacterium]MBU52463.1 hypothetical protein [Deltaproteobacteria bacterium]HAA54806.1 hypothetical protein [Myxococcales bacterium]|tara:strand:+ start:4771 stop:5592 length:822 start_codon:yes stop_codon:yes gene_type:complete
MTHDPEHEPSDLPLEEQLGKIDEGAQLQLSPPTGELLIEHHTSEPPGFTMADFVVIFISYFFAIFAAFGVATAFVSHPDQQTKHGLNLLITAIANVFLVGLYLMRGRLMYKMSWDALGFRLPSWKESWPWLVFFVPVVLLFTNAYVYVLKLLFAIPAPKQQIADLLGPHMPLWIRGLAVVLILVFAPLAEELLYRGVLFKALGRMMPMQFAAIVSGLLFGAAHLQAHTIIPLAFLGYLLAIAYHKTRSMYLIIGLHAANNALAFVSLLLTQGS